MLKIATEGGFPPFNMTRPDGTLDGYEIDLAKDLCARMEIKCEIVTQEWDGAVPALQSRKFDVLMAAMSITPEREKMVDFSIPYQLGLMGFAAMADTPVAELPGTGEAINISSIRINSPKLSKNGNLYSKARQLVCRAVAVMQFSLKNTLRT